MEWKYNHVNAQLKPEDRKIRGIKKKKKITNRKIDSNIVDINPTISIIILNAND